MSSSPLEKTRYVESLRSAAALFTAHEQTARVNQISQFARIFTGCEVVADFIAVSSAILFSYVLYRGLHLGAEAAYPFPVIAAIACVFAGVFLLMLANEGAYRQDNSLLRVKETETILRVSAKAFLFAIPVSFLIHLLFSRWLIAIAFFGVPLFLLVERQLSYSLIRWFHSHGYGVRKVVIYGAGLTGRRIFSALARSPKMGLDPVLFVDEDPRRAGTTIYEASYHRRRSAMVLQGPIDSEMLRGIGAEKVIVAVPSLSGRRFLEIATETAAAGASISFVPNHFLPTDCWMDYIELDGVLLGSVTDPRPFLGYSILKRIFDILGSSLLLVVLSPLLLLLTILIRLTSPGSAIFSHDRIGHYGRHFRIYKFRTMYSDAPHQAASPMSPDDPRITPIGRFLRRTSLDELPQLVNVLMGHMSLVGPRPEMPFIVADYTEFHKQRLTVKPGLTGLWQLSADRAIPIHQNLEYDLYYIRNRSFFMDLAILLHTLVFAFRGV